MTQATITQAMRTLMQAMCDASVTIGEQSIKLSEGGKKLGALAKAAGLDRKGLHASLVEMLAIYPAYKGSLQESGYFEGGSAAQQAYSRIMRATFGSAVANQKVVKVPKELQAAIAKLLTTYDKAQLNAAIKRVK